jgi:hypothetical protein
MSYVIELGSYSGEGQYKQWDSIGWYAGIDQISRDIIVKEIHLAFIFGIREEADRVAKNSKGLNQSRVVPAPPEFKPSNPDTIRK